MNDQSLSRTVSSIEELEAIYGEPLGQSLVKEIDHISDHYRAFIEKSPFLVLASVADEGGQLGVCCRVDKERLRAGAARRAAPELLEARKLCVGGQRVEAVGGHVADRQPARVP